MAIALLLGVSACGGGGIMGITSVPPPPPPPPPPPETQTCPDGSVIPVTDTCPPPQAQLSAVNIFPAVTATTQLAALGVESDHTNLNDDGFFVSYDADSGLYIFDVPASGPGAFYENTANTPNDHHWSGELVGETGPQVFISVLKPTPTNSVFTLEYSSLAEYVADNGAFGHVAFGLTTPSGAVPTTGSASYSALVRGSTIGEQALIGGTATLQFDFGAGTLGGHFDAAYADYAGGWSPLGRYDFSNTVFGVGSTTFSGSMSDAASGDTGTFEGLFTGPAAQELIAHWRTSFMFGVWVGRRDP